MLVPRCLQLKAVAVTAPQLLGAIQTQGFCHTGKKRGLFEVHRRAGKLDFRTDRVTQGATGCQREIGVVRAKVNASRPLEFQEPFIQSAGAGSIGQNSGEGFENSTATCESPACRGPW